VEGLAGWRFEKKECGQLPALLIRG
jgi:hypothetical protein